MGTRAGPAAAVRRMYEELADGLDPTGVIEALATALDVEVVLAMEVSLSGAAPPNMALAERGGNSRAPGLSDYRVGRYLNDPGIGLVARAGGRVGDFDMHRDLDADFLAADPFSRWCRDEVRLDARAAAWDRETPDRLFAVSANRAVGRPPLDEAGRRLLLETFAHLRRVRRLRRLAGVRPEGSELVLDADGRVQQATPSAARLMAGGRGLTLRRDRLVADDRRDRPALDAMLACAVLPPAMGGREGAAALRRAADHRPLLVRAHPLAPTPGVGAYLGGALVRMLDPADAVPARRDEWRMLFGFTPAEARLAAALLADEANLREVAERLGVSHNTARTQAASLYGKAGVRGQVGLVRLLTRLG